jgi:hypothetical protein
MTRVVSEVNFMPLEPPVGEFNLSRLERVIYGPGKIATLKDEMERRDLHRGLVVTTRGVAELPILKEVTGALGSRCAGVFAGVVMHVPRKTTELLQKEIERFEADSLISFGGGSPIDSAKAAAYGLLPGRTRPYRGSHDPLGGGIHVGRRGYGRIHTRQEQRRLRPACDAAHRDRRPSADARHPGLAMGHDGDACSGSRHRVRLCHSAPAHQRRARQ